MTQKPPMEPEGEPVTRPDGIARKGGSGEGADTALEALIRRRRQAEAPIDPSDTGSPNDEPAR